MDIPNETTREESVAQIESALEEIKPFLRGRDPFTQGAIIGALFGTWLHGHRVPDNPAHQKKLRGELADHTSRMAVSWCAMLDQMEKERNNAG